MYLEALWDAMWLQDRGFALEVSTEGVQTRGSWEVIRENKKTRGLQMYRSNNSNKILHLTRTQEVRMQRWMRGKASCLAESSFFLPLVFTEQVLYVKGARSQGS